MTPEMFPLDDDTPEFDHHYYCPICQLQWTQNGETDICPGCNSGFIGEVTILTPEMRANFVEMPDEDTQPIVREVKETTTFEGGDWCSVHQRRLLGHYTDEGGRTYDLYECVYCGQESKVYDMEDY